MDGDGDASGVPWGVTGTVITVPFPAVAVALPVGVA